MGVWVEKETIWRTSPGRTGKIVVNESSPRRPQLAAPAPAKGTFVQLGAFASEANAREAANSVAGQVSMAGKYWVARMGPFASKTDTDAALAKARAAGYGEAIVRRVN